MRAKATFGMSDSTIGLRPSVFVYVGSLCRLLNDAMVTSAGLKANLISTSFYGFKFLCQYYAVANGVGRVVPLV